MLVGRPNHLVQVWEISEKWEGSRLQGFVSKFEHGQQIKVMRRPEDEPEVEIIDQQNMRHAQGKAEIGLKYTITLPKGK